MTLLLVRHCSALGQEPDAPLSSEGAQQAHDLARFLAAYGVTRIVSSPYRRAVASAEPLADVARIPVTIDERLAERRLGHVEDGDWRSALQRSFVDHSVCLEGGESSREALQRGRIVLDEALAALPEKTAIFSHGNLLSLIAHSINPALGYDFWAALSNPDVFEVMRGERGVTLQRIWRTPQR